MGHYAKIENDIVTNVIVADGDFIETLDGEWIQTSYNTRGGVHELGGIPLRKNFAGVGYTYDREKDAFIPFKPSDDYILNEDKCIWELPLHLINENSGSF
jgi:hypothetical protein